jgi:hypothetical protein
MGIDPKFKVELSVNGKSIQMNEFVHKIVGNLILAILRSIKLDEEPKSATLNLKVE